MARTMATVTERRAAAELRRRQAGEAGERGGDVAYRQYRSAVAGLGRSRVVDTPTQVRAASEPRNGKDMVHTSGFFTRYERGYPMWDSFGEYEERIARGAGRATIAANPNVMFLVNHKGVTMARTHNGTLFLEERDEGGFHDAWLNPERPDVQIIKAAMNDGDVEEMSFAFLIPDGAGEWSEDFMTFEIRSYDIDRGDVSAVNMGANPNTDIAARAGQILDELDHLPEGALPEASARLARRGAEPRERIEVRSQPRTVDPKASRAVRALQGRQARTAARYVELAERNGLSVAEVVNTQLPWYEIRERRAAGDEGASTRQAESTDVFIYDEIGGSFGVDAETFARDLNEITTPQINIRIASPGGSMFDGETIHSAILHHPAHTTGYVDGLAASAASMIAIACDELVVMPAGELMVHDASMTTDGNAADHGKGQTFLDRHSNHIADLYAAKMGVSTQEARDLMLAETWLFSNEAVEIGLADRAGTRADMLPEGDPAEARMARKHDLSQWPYRYQGRAAAPEPRLTRKADTSELNISDALRDAHRDLVNAVSAGGSSAPAPTGRSISLIEAQLEADLI
jgi:HK97 family phage prohead protease